MRLFVGVTLAGEIRLAAAATARELQRRLDSGVRAAWVQPDKMHLTVRFIGHVDDARVAAIVDGLEAPLRLAPFDVVLSGCGAFPSTGPPRVFWIGLSEGLASLRAMHDEFNRRLRPFGFEAEDRPYSAHLTLARVKDIPRESVRTTRGVLAALHVPPARCRVDHATVFQSRLSAKGATYVPLAEVPFQQLG